MACLVVHGTFILVVLYKCISNTKFQPMNLFVEMACNSKKCFKKLMDRKNVLESCKIKKSKIEVIEGGEKFIRKTHPNWKMDDWMTYL